MDEQFLNNEIRKRRAWQADIDSLASQDLDLLDIDDDELVEEDEAGCPLPSTPEDNQLLEEEVCLFIFYNLHSIPYQIVTLF